MKMIEIFVLLRSKIVEYCDNMSDVCPPDVVQPESTECRPIEGVCDVTEVCDVRVPNNNKQDFWFNIFNIFFLAFLFPFNRVKMQLVHLI